MSIGVALGVLLPFSLIGLVIFSTGRKLLVGNFLIKGYSQIFYFGLLFLLLFVLNLLSIYFNEFISIFNPRTPLIILITGLLLIFLQKPNIIYVRYSSNIFLVLALLNLFVVLAEIFFYYVDSEIFQLIRSFFEYTGNPKILIRENRFGTFLRPNGIFGGPHIGSLLVSVFACSKLMLKARHIKVFKRLLWWSAIIILIGFMGSGQTIVATIAIASTFEYFKCGKIGRFIILSVVLPVLVFLLFEWGKDVGHQSGNHLSLNRIYIEIGVVIPFFKKTNCFIFGCGLDPDAFMGNIFLLTPQIEALAASAVTLTDLGLLIVLESYGFLFVAGIMALIVFYYIKFRTQKETKIIIISLVIGNLMTLLHYPLVFTGTGFSLMFYNACFIFYNRWKMENRIIRHSKNTFIASNIKQHRDGLTTEGV
jgi:hypothetical protein